MMTSDIITFQKCILWEALQFDLEQFMTSTHFEFQSSETKLWVPSQQGQKSPKDMTSLFVESVESHEHISLQVPWHLASSGHGSLLYVMLQSLFEDRQWVCTSTGSLSY